MVCKMLGIVDDIIEFVKGIAGGIEDVIDVIDSINPFRVSADNGAQGGDIMRLVSYTIYFCPFMATGPQPRRW
jgi:hypothetical protein